MGQNFCIYNCKYFSVEKATSIHARYARISLPLLPEMVKIHLLIETLSIFVFTDNIGKNAKARRRQVDPAKGTVHTDVPNPKTCYENRN